MKCMRLLPFILIFLGIVSCDKRKDMDQLAKPDLNQLSIGPDDVLLLPVSDTVIADGISLTELELRVGRNVRATTDAVRFTCTLGSFSNGDTSITVALDEQGRARTTISSAVEGVCQVCAGTESLFTSASIYFIAPADFSLNVSQDTMPADNYSYATIKIIPVISALSAGSQIVLSTDQGVFANGNPSVSFHVTNNDTITAYMRNIRATLSHVTVAMGNRNQVVLVPFKPAFPDQITVSPTATYLPSSFTAQTVVTALLSRYQGTVSEGQHVYFYDSTAVNTHVGTFTNIGSSNANGVVTSTYSLQDTSYHGLVYIKGRVSGDSGYIFGVSQILIQ